jgi:curved DNA-binding protein CbpA
MASDPFRLLGLVAGPGLTDDDVRAAWRRVAAATHPDRADGGDPAAFAAAAAAYSDLRTAFGRGEALVGLAGRRRARPAGARPAGARGRPAGRPGRPAAAIWRPLAAWAGRIAGGHPGRLALRLLAVVTVSVLVIMVNGGRPASPALIIGALTWLLRSARRDLAARRPGPRTPARTGPRARDAAR